MTQISNSMHLQAQGQGCQQGVSLPAWANQAGQPATLSFHQLSSSESMNSRDQVWEPGQELGLENYVQGPSKPHYQSHVLWLAVHEFVELVLQEHAW